MLLCVLHCRLYSNKHNRLTLLFVLPLNINYLKKRPSDYISESNSLTAYKLTTVVESVAHSSSV